MKNKKIIVLALVLLIIAGIVVVGLKGFNVNFMLKQHDSLEYRIENDFEVSDVENIAKEVFGNKKFEIKVIEFFSDAVSIHAENITTEEADNLVKKLDEKYKTVSEEVVTETTEENKNYNIVSNPKIRLFSLVKPYLIPSTIAGAIIVCYLAVRYRKLGAVKVALELVAWVIITALSIVSVLAIVRFPINTYVMPAIMLVEMVEIVAFCIGKENKLNKLKEE